jgi:hypothetical protein
MASISAAQSAWATVDERPNMKTADAKTILILFSILRLDDLRFTLVDIALSTYCGKFSVAKRVHVSEVRVAVHRARRLKLHFHFSASSAII